MLGEKRSELYDASIERLCSSDPSDPARSTAALDDKGGQAMENLFGIGIIILIGLIVLGAALRPSPPQPTTYVLLAPAPPKPEQDSGGGALLVMLLVVIIGLALFQI